MGPAHLRLTAAFSTMLPDTRYLRQAKFKPEAAAHRGAFPFTLPAVLALESIDFHPKVTFFIGENGSGKSTVLEALAVAARLNAEGGSKNFHFGTRESHSALHRHLRLTRGVARPRDAFFLRAESFYNVATEIERLDAIHPLMSAYGGLSPHAQSHGESFLALLMNRFRGKGLYFLDEPESALSPSRQLAVLARIHDLAKDDSQFIIATHSPLLMAYPEARIYEFSKEGIRRVEYGETEHFRITRDFLMNPQRSLEILLHG